MTQLTVEETAKTFHKKANNESKVVPKLEVGEYVAQGDINFILS